LKESEISYRKIISIEWVKEKANAIVNKYNPEKIILFGSMANGLPTQDSDADILVILKTDKPTFEMGVEIAMSFKHDFPIDIIVKTPEEIANRMEIGDSFIQNIIHEGIVLYERDTKGMDR